MAFNYQLWIDQVELVFRDKGDLTDNWKEWADWEQLCKSGLSGKNAAIEVLKAREKARQDKIDSF